MFLVFEERASLLEQKSLENFKNNKFKLKKRDILFKRDKVK